ncbi:hypothetical protein JCM10213v2_005893 [Rhodosporidiobolus nylandii]
MTAVRTAGVDAAREQLTRFIPTMPLPAAPVLANPAWSTHTSYAQALHHEFEAPEDEMIQDYERLEHVGDALLGAEVTLLVVKSVLVSNSTLSLLSVQLHFPERVLAAQAQLWNVRHNPNVQACVFEAYVAALYEEHGQQAVHEFLRGIYEQLLPIVVDTLRPFHTATAEVEMPQRNFVGELGEWSVARGSAASRSVAYGPNEAAPGGWSVSCTVSDTAQAKLSEPHTFSGTASTAKKARMDAAMRACAWIGIA